MIRVIRTFNKFTDIRAKYQYILPFPQVPVVCALRHYTLNTLRRLGKKTHVINKL